MTEHYVLDGIEPVEVDALTWAKWFEKNDRKIALARLANRVTVSTVFLGLDHQYGDGPPLLFETMIFGGAEDQWCDRYTTWEQAISGHVDAIFRALKAEDES